MDKVVLFCDHNIGFRLAEYLINYNQIQVLRIYTNKKTGSEWWKDAHELNTVNNVEVLDYDRDSINQILATDFDYLLLFSWRHIVPPQLVNAPKKGCINLHYSLLPLHRGVYPVNWSIISGDSITGVTFHFVNNAIDEGDIISQSKINIELADTAHSLLFKLDDLAFDLFKKIWPERVIWDKIRIAQNNGLATYHSKSDFESVSNLNFDGVFKTMDFINLIRGKSFNQSQIVLYADSENTKFKMSISLESENTN